MIRRMNHLRTYNKKLTTLISIGGWNEGSDKYSMLVKSSKNRQIFIKSVLKFLKRFDLDGLDIDWEYPSMQANSDQERRIGREKDREDFVKLLKELRDAFKPYGYVLSIAVSAGKDTIDRAYSVPEISNYVDYINLMSYDFHGAWEMQTGHNAPMDSYPNFSEKEKIFTVKYAVNYWLGKNVDPKKLILGIPLYGRTFTLATSNDSIHAPTIGHGGRSGPFTRTDGILGYNEICRILSQGWIVHRDPIEMIPYAVHADQWLGFDDAESIKTKLSFLIAKQLGGAMLWSIDTDDFGGYCGQGKFPLTRMISKQLNKVDGPDPKIDVYHYHRSSTDSTYATKTSPTTLPSTKNHPELTMSPAKFQCKRFGFFADPLDPRIFHQCLRKKSGKWKDYNFRCSVGTHFDERFHVCVGD
ncbi:Chitotriosidase-1 [Sarcoptes scabiei]|uniref:Chitotriosidase-1 n=3 Tax=Sarcoptes scabiei TaxID=52283 RepID=A0A834R6Q1_SARSC|nr:Chitotriosidase-1 [Sarcoptes scabiei]